MNANLAQHYGEFQLGLQDELKYKVRLVGELEEVLKWMNYNSEAYRKLQFKILKEKIMVNVMCKFTSQEPIYDLEPHPYLELLCELQLQNKMLQYMAKKSYEDIVARIDKPRKEKLDLFVKNTRGKRVNRETKAKSIESYFKIDKEGKINVIDGEALQKNIDMYKEDNNNLSEIIKGIDKAMKKEEEKIKQPELELKVSNQ